MVKRINPTRYLLGDVKIEVAPYFLYEASTFYIYKNRAELRGSKFFKSNEDLGIDCKVRFINANEYYIEKSVTLLAAPIEFIKERKLKIYEPKKKKKK